MSPKVSGDCIFCKIVAGTIPSQAIRSNASFLAILDAFPVTLGQTVVMTRDHESSYIFELDDGLLHELVQFARETAQALDRALESSRCIVVAEGLEIDHAHLKLYPVLLRGTESSIGQAVATWRASPDRRNAPSTEELRKLAEQIARAA
jgi:histidine triad (HIT) family protein